MIYDDELSPQQKKNSQKNYNYYNFINGFSYMCLGETVLILFAVRMQSPNYIVALLGSMIYIGFLLLPLGKFMTAKYGAVTSQANFWVLRNVSAVIVALSAPISIWVNKSLAIIFLLLGAFFFYGFRAAGVVMGQPLVGEICEENKRGKFLAFSTMLFYLSGLISLTIISILLKYSQSIWLLAGVIIVGATMGVTASSFFRKIDESKKIKEAAQKPIKGQIKPILKDKYIHRQLVAGMVLNLVFILTVPISMLTIKRGFGVSDTTALIFSLVQFGTASFASYLSGIISKYLGPRISIIIGYWMFATVALFWIIVPKGTTLFFLSIPFFLCGMGVGISNNSLIHYFLMSVEPLKQVTASMFISIATGVGAGVSGMFLGGGLLRILEPYFVDNTNTTSLYKTYFIIVMFLIIILSYFIYRLEKIIDKISKENG